MKQTFFIFLFTLICSFSFAQIDKYTINKNGNWCTIEEPVHKTYETGSDPSMVLIGYGICKNGNENQFTLEIAPYGKVFESMRKNLEKDEINTNNSLIGSFEVEFTLADNSKSKLIFFYERDLGNQKTVWYNGASAISIDNQLTMQSREFRKLMKHNVKSIRFLSQDKYIEPKVDVTLHTANTLPAMLKDLGLQGLFGNSTTKNTTSKTTPKTTFSNTKKTFTVKGINFTMIPVQGGTFTMGSKEFIDCPPHKVTLSSYMIGETEVTQALWKAVMGTNPTSKNNKIGNNYPVTDVSWDDCQVFIKNLNALTGQNFRLPTEAEWEFAARGGNKSRGYAYSGSNTPSKVAWYCDNSGFSMHAVKTKVPNELGIYDMSGNVKEWCKDYFDPIYNSEPQTNPQGPSSGGYRVLRDFCYSHDCEKVYRRSGSTNTASGTTVGLRLAL